MKHIKPATKNTTPCELFAGSATANAPITTRNIPTKRRVTAANTVRQFSLTLGCLQQEVVVSSSDDILPYSCINESLSRDVVSSYL